MPLLQEEDYIDDLKDAERVEYEQSDEPPFLVALSGKPKGVAF